jgi:hypothetical protein
MVWIDPRTAIAVMSGISYGAVYLWAVGDIDTGGPGAWQWQPVELSLERLTAMRSPMHFEAVAMVQAGPLFMLVSPLNLLIATLLGTLLIANVHGAFELRRHVACNARPGTGMLSASTLPALLAGGACCAPSLLILLGIPGLGAFAALFAWLVPLSVVALMASRWWQRRLGASPLLGWL